MKDVELERARQAVRILDILDGAKMPFETKTGEQGWVVYVSGKRVASDVSLAECLAQLAQAIVLVDP